MRHQDNTPSGSAAVVSVDYRLAPEARLPTAVDDCFAALQWVAQNAERLTGHKLPLIVGGDSAGGNLSAVMAILARGLLSSSMPCLPSSMICGA
jgi:acetyl esterase/lipase